MKILMTLYQIQDYGGIINHLENLTHGFKRNGDEVDVVMLCPKHKITNDEFFEILKERFHLLTLLFLCGASLFIGKRLFISLLFSQEI